MRGHSILTAAVALASLGMSQAALAAGVSLAVGDEVTAVNCTTNAVLTMSGGGGVVGGVQADLLFDSSVFSLVDTSNPCTLAGGLSGEADANLIVDEPTPAGMSRLRIVVTNSDTRAYPDGALATCELSVAAGILPGTYTFQIDTTQAPPDVSDVKGNELPDGAYRNGTVTVGNPTGCGGCPTP